MEQLKLTEGKTVAVGQKMDLVFYTLQLAFFYMDFDLVSKSIDKAKKSVSIRLFGCVFFLTILRGLCN